MQPRPYQQRLIHDIRTALKTYQHVMVQSPTGSGKSFIFSFITHGARAKNKRVWVIVPMKQLIRQTSKHFSKWQIPHGMITAGNNESIAYNVHIVSKQTLERRWDKIKNWPDIIIIDEAHQNYDFQVKLKAYAPDTVRLIGLTATPERLSGEGLSDIYDTLVEGADIRELTELGYLSPVRYFSPPLEGLDEIHKKGYDYDAEELEALFKRRAIYGKVVQHYRKLAHKRPTIVFCRDIAAAERWAKTFRDAGYKFESIDGRMKDKKRNMLIKALENGEIDGLTSVNLISIGFDCPRIECVIKLRPTESKALDSQMNGRGMRIYPGKKDVIILDFVNNLQTHGHPYSSYSWNFYGAKKRKKKGQHIDSIKLCQKCFMYYEGEKCPYCGYEKEKKTRSDLKEVDGRLIEVKGPIPLAERDSEEKQEYQDRINTAVDTCRNAENEIDSGAVGELLKIAEELGRRPMWVYWKLSSTYIGKDGNEVKRKTVNNPLLYEIARQKGYANGWCYYKRKEIKQKLGQK